MLAGSRDAVNADAEPDDIEKCRWVRAVVRRVDHEAYGADDVQRVIEQRLAIELAQRQQPIGGEDDHRRQPASDFDECFQMSSLPWADDKENGPVSCPTGP